MDIYVTAALYTLITIMGIGYTVLGLEYRRPWAFIGGCFSFYSLFLMLLG